MTTVNPAILLSLFALETGLFSVSQAFSRGYLDTITAGHLNVEHNHIRVMFPGKFYGLKAIFCFSDHANVALFFQKLTNTPPDDT